MKNRNSPARGCCGEGVRFRVRAETCDGVFVPNVMIWAVSEDGETSFSALAGGASPYWANLTVPGPGTYRISAASNACDGSYVATVVVEAGGSYVVPFVCDGLPMFTLPASWMGVFPTCFKDATHDGTEPHAILEFHDLEYLGRDEIGVGWLRLRGDAPWVDLSDLHGKFVPQRVHLDPNPCPEVGGDRAVVFAPMAYSSPGWDCDCYVDDGLGRDKVLVSSTLGSRTVDGTIGSGGVTFTASIGPVLLGEEDVEECGGGEFRAEPTFGNANVPVTIAWDLCGAEPVAMMGIPHPSGEWWHHRWYSACPFVAANLRYRVHRSVAGTLRWYQATSYEVHSDVSPVSVTFVFEESPGAYDVYDDPDDIPTAPIGSAVAGSITITELM